MANIIKRHANIGQALALNSEPESIVPYYAKWSETYDSDVIDGYVGLGLIGELMHQHVQSEHCKLVEKQPSKLRVVDVGCGTGLGGEGLNSLGYNHLEGLDISPEMIEKARLSGWYSELYDRINLNEPLPSYLTNRYDVAVCLGTFTPGHVHPEALIQLVQMTKPSGVVVVSTRPEYYETTSFQEVSDDLETSGAVQLHECRFNAPYRDDGKAHYWIYNVLT